MSQENRCICKRKLKLSDLPCGKCKHRFCGLHRIPEDHGCTHDFRAEGREILIKQLVPTEDIKIQKI